MPYRAHEKIYHKKLRRDFFCPAPCLLPNPTLALQQGLHREITKNIQGLTLCYVMLASRLVFLSWTLSPTPSYPGLATGTSQGDINNKYSGTDPMLCYACVETCFSVLHLVRHPAQTQKTIAECRPTKQSYGWEPHKT